MLVIGYMPRIEIWEDILRQVKSSTASRVSFSLAYREAIMKENLKP